MWVDEIEFNRFTCKDMYGETKDLDTNEISLYIVMTRKCNTNCRFCEYHKGTSEVDIEILKKRIQELMQVCDITTLHFTGGEPSIELEKVNEICRYVKEVNPLITTSMNTNGSRLKELEGIEELDNIALSRHHYDDGKNEEIFRNKVCSTKDIERFKEKNKIHISCNLIKSYIDSKEEIEKYLDYVGKLGINDVGFVSLMGINEYSKERYVDFNKIGIELIKDLKKIRHYCNGDSCRCSNYFYTTKDLQLISIYHRHAIKSDKKADMLVYENNHIKQGFQGNIII